MAAPIEQHVAWLEEARSRLAEMEERDAGVVIPKVPTPFIVLPDPVIERAQAANLRISTDSGVHEHKKSSPGIGIVVTDNTKDKQVEVMALESGSTDRAMSDHLASDSPEIAFTSSSSADSSSSPTSSDDDPDDDDDDSSTFLNHHDDSNVLHESNGVSTYTEFTTEAQHHHHQQQQKKEEQEARVQQEEPEEKNLEEDGQQPREQQKQQQQHQQQQPERDPQQQQQQPQQTQIPVPCRPAMPLCSSSGLASPLRRRKTPPKEIWIFGYGSLIWKCDYPVVEEKWGHVTGFRRRLWQGSPDHRGTARRPGRVFTLLPTALVQDLEARVNAPNGSPRVPPHGEDDAGEDRVYGKCFRLDPLHADRVLAEIDEREIAGFLKKMVVVTCTDGSLQPSLVYSAIATNEHFLGAETEKVIAAHVWCSRGPSGPNSEYVLRTHDTLVAGSKEHASEIRVDAHLKSISAHLRVLRNSRPAKRRDFLCGSRLFCRGRMVQICKPAEWPLVYYFFLDEHDTDGDGMGKAKERVVYHCNVIDDEWLPFSVPQKESELDGNESPQDGQATQDKSTKLERNVLTLAPLK